MEVYGVVAGAGEEGEGGAEAAGGVLGVFGFDGELARGGVEAGEEAGGGEEGWVWGTGDGSVVGHPVEEPVVGFVGGGDLEGYQHLAAEVGAGGCEGPAEELGGAG